jgi:hypothetical protein
MSTPAGGLLSANMNIIVGSHKSMSPVVGSHQLGGALRYFHSIILINVFLNSYGHFYFVAVKGF